ncbi:MAG: exodeoxyribonuclease VII large subunit [Acidimicrobiia bacterium]
MSSLFDATPSASSLDEMTFSVLELNTAVRQVLEVAFPHDLWVQGEVQRVSTSRNGHTYFQLVERDDDGNIKAALDVACWAGERRRIERDVRDHGGLTLESDTPIRIRGRVTLYPQGGRFQFLMTGYDPTFTLGVLEAQREKTLRMLSEEGLLGRNAALAFPELPLRIAMITSVDSAAYHDALRTLEESGFAFHIVTFDTQVQGRGAPEQIAAAITAAPRHAPDVVLVIRGGGSRGDLAAFDHEAVARAIALCPIPVVTGIGHEIDTSVADAVAHTAAKTPTAAAHLLVQAIAEVRHALLESQRRVVDAALEQLDTAKSALLAIGARLRVCATQRAVLEQARLAHAMQRIRSNARRAIVRADQQRVRASARVRLAPQRLAPFVVALDGYARQVRALDPRRVMERGYSITTFNGKVVRSTGEVAVGEELRTEVADGTIVSRVEQTGA